MTLDSGLLCKPYSAIRNGEFLPSIAMRVDSAILAVVVAFLLPLRLLSLVVRLNSSGSAGDLRRSCTAFAIAAALLSAIFALPRDHVGRTGHCGVPVADAGEDGMGRELRLEVEQLKLQLNRFESFWENNSKTSDDKRHGSEEDVEVVKAMGLDIQALIKEQENIKAILVKMHTEWDNNSKASDDKGHVSEEDGEVVKAMGLDIQALIKEQENIKELLWISDSTVKSVTNEVQILSADSRKMNSDIYNVWSLANDTKKAVEALHSDVKKVQVITDESRKMSSSIHQVWSLAKDTGKKVEALYADIEKSPEYSIPPSSSPISSTGVQKPATVPAAGRWGQPGGGPARTRPSSSPSLVAAPPPR